MPLVATKRCVVIIACLALSLLPSTSRAQTTTISTEYLMTLYAPLDSDQAVDSTLYIANVRPGGWVKGPKINGTIIAPSGDWFRVMPSGVGRPDIRLTIRTNDGALIYMTYGGVFKDTKASAESAANGKVLTSRDFYLIIAPVMQTAAKQYAWVNDVQCIGKIVSYKAESYVKYDIFVVR